MPVTKTPVAKWPEMISVWAKKNNITRCTAAEVAKDALSLGVGPFGTITLRGISRILIASGAIRMRTGKERLFIFPEDGSFDMHVEQQAASDVGIGELLDQMQALLSQIRKKIGSGKPQTDSRSAAEQRNWFST